MEMIIIDMMIAANTSMKRNVNVIGLFLSEEGICYVGTLDLFSEHYLNLLSNVVSVARLKVCETPVSDLECDINFDI